jgi:hypothetical protein
MNRGLGGNLGKSRTLKEINPPPPPHQTMAYYFYPTTLGYFQLVVGIGVTWGCRYPSSIPPPPELETKPISTHFLTWLLYKLKFLIPMVDFFSPPPNILSQFFNIIQHIHLTPSFYYI